MKLTDKQIEEALKLLTTGATVEETKLKEKALERLITYVTEQALVKGRDAALGRY